MDIEKAKELSKKIISRIGLGQVIGIDLDKNLTLQQVIIRKANQLYALIPDGLFGKIKIRPRGKVTTSLREQMKNRIESYRQMAGCDLVLDNVRGAYPTMVYRTLFGLIILQENRKTEGIQEIWITDTEVKTALNRRSKLKIISNRIAEVYNTTKQQIRENLKQ